MKQVIFKDKNSTQLTTHINRSNDVVICLEQEHEFLVYVFDDLEDIKDFIKELQKVKKEFKHINNLDNG